MGEALVIDRRGVYFAEPRERFGVMNGLALHRGAGAAPRCQMVTFPTAFAYGGAGSYCGKI